MSRCRLSCGSTPQARGPCTSSPSRIGAAHRRRPRERSHPSTARLARSDCARGRGLARQPQQPNLPQQRHILHVVDRPLLRLLPPADRRGPLCRRRVCAPSAGRVTQFGLSRLRGDHRVVLGQHRTAQDLLRGPGAILDGAVLGAPPRSSLLRVCVPRRRLIRLFRELPLAPSRKRRRCLPAVLDGHGSSRPSQLVPPTRPAARLVFVLHS